MRIILNKEIRSVYFTSLKNITKYTWGKLADELEVNGRMLRSWRSGEFTLPKSVCDRIKMKYNISIPSESLFINSYWNNKKAGIKGGFARNKIYGNPGTPEGRKKGGIKSVIINTLKKTGFKIEKRIELPRLSKELAELVGILIGDGGITKYQITITLNYFKDERYSYFVKKLFTKLFKTDISLFKLRNRSVISIVANGKAFVDFFNKLGLPKGNKVEHQIDIPSWVNNNIKYRRACIRGIFDTDGCIYLDKHKRNGKIYKSLNLAITNASQKLLDSIYDIFVDEQFRPTKSSKRSIRLRNIKDILKFFDIMGSSNIHNNQFFQKFMKERYPSGHTGTVSKTVGV